MCHLHFNVKCPFFCELTIFLFISLFDKKRKFSNSVVPVPPVLKFCLKILRTRLKTLQIGYLLWEDIKYHFIFKGAHAFWVFCEASYSLCCIFQELPFGFPWCPQETGGGERNASFCRARAGIPYSHSQGAAEPPTSSPILFHPTTLLG